jgi:hypothetical protein
MPFTPYCLLRQIPPRAPDRRSLPASESDQASLGSAGNAGPNLEQNTVGDQSLVQRDSFQLLEYHDISPDYEKDLMEICKDFFKSCVKCSNSLDIICRHWSPIVRKFKKLETQEMKKGLTLEQKNWVTTRELTSWMPSISGAPTGHLRGTPRCLDWPDARRQSSWTT